MITRTRPPIIPSQDAITLTSRRAISLEKLAALCGGSASPDPVQHASGHHDGAGSVRASDTPPAPAGLASSSEATAAASAAIAPEAAAAAAASPLVHALRPLSWRLDRDEASSTFNLMRR